MSLTGDHRPDGQITGEIMHSGVPAVVSLPLLVFVGSILVVRLTTLRSTVADRRLNTALAFFALYCLLGDRTGQSAIVTWFGTRVSPAFLYGLSELALIPAAGALFLIGYTWISDIEPRYLVWLVYPAVAVCTLVMFVLEVKAQAHNITLNIYSAWAVIAYSTSPVGALATIVCHDSLIYSLSVMVIITCIRELRRRPDRRTVAICAAVGTVAVGVLSQEVSVSVAIALAAAGQHNDYINGVCAIDRFAIDIWLYPGAGVTAIPLGARTLERLGWDKYSLRRKRLQPLWRDLTTACPEIIYLTTADVANNRPRFLLHRTVVEIRDGILILSRYASERNEIIVHELAESPAFRQALRLALAWTAKTTGEPPSGDFSARQSAAAELMDESAELTDLAAHWPTAKALTDAVSQTVAKRRLAHRGVAGF